MTMVLEYAKPVPRRVPWKGTLALSGLLLSFMNWQVTVCMCGYQGKEGLPGNVLAVGLTVWGFSMRAGGWGSRGMAAIGVILTVVQLVINAYTVKLGLG